MNMEAQISLSELTTTLPSVTETSSVEDMPLGDIPSAFPTARDSKTAILSPTATTGHRTNSSRSPSSNRAPSGGNAFVKGLIGSIRSISRNRQAAPEERRTETRRPSGTSSLSLAGLDDSAMHLIGCDCD